MNLIIQLGSFFWKTLFNFKQIMLLFISSIMGIFNLTRANFRIVINLTLRQIYFTGIQAIPLIGGIAILFGTIVLLKSFIQFPLINIEAVLGEIIVIVIIRTLAPLMTSFIIISRSITAISTELSNMKLNGETTTLEIMGIDPNVMLIIPRVIAVATSTFIMIIFFDLMVLLTSITFVSLVWNIGIGNFVQMLLSSIKVSDLFITFEKGIFYGAGIAIISCYFGLSVKKSITEIPKAAINSVISSLTFVFFLEMIITAINFLI